MELEWSHKVSNLASKSMKHKKIINADPLPITIDIVNLCGYIEKEIDSICGVKNMTRQMYRFFQQLVMTSLIIHNKRRCNEVASLHHYELC